MLCCCHHLRPKHFSDLTVFLGAYANIYLISANSWDIILKISKFTKVRFNIKCFIYTYIYEILFLCIIL